MSKKINFIAKKREKAGKGVSRALHREGRIPAVIYGDHKEPVLIDISEKEANVEYYKGHMFTSVVNIDADGEKFVCVARDVALDPVKDNVIHADFLRVTKKTKIHVKVPLHVVGQDDCEALSRGGTLMADRHEIELLCSAMDIPESIEVDVSSCEMGDSILAKDLTLPAGSSLGHDHGEYSVASILAPRVIKDDDEESEGESSEEETSESE